MEQYLVIWANVLTVHDNFGDALTYAQIMTHEEEYCKNAMIISVHSDEDSDIVVADITIVIWVRGATYVVKEMEI